MCKTMQTNRRRGLTLLELLLVVFILALVAASAVAIADRADEQFRYEETRSRLKQIRTAVVGENEPVYNGRKHLTGFVADMGSLPQNMMELVYGVQDNGDGADKEFPSFGQMPFTLFDPTPDPNTGLNNDDGDEIFLTAPEHLLSKGFRGVPVVGPPAHYRGAYLQLPAGRGKFYYDPDADKFRDGWGTTANKLANDEGVIMINGSTPISDNNSDTLGHGWYWASTPSSSFGVDTLTIASVGSDGVPGQSSLSDPYDADVSELIGPDDWKINISSVTVEVFNNTGAALSGSHYRVSILAYDVRAGKWKRYTSSTVYNSLSPIEPSLFRFQNSSRDPFVPIGEHLVLLVDDPNGISHDIGDEVIDVAFANKAINVVFSPVSSVTVSSNASWVSVTPVSTDPDGNRQQTIDVIQKPTDESFTLKIDETDTQPIAYNASADDIRLRIEQTIYPEKVIAATGGPLSGRYVSRIQVFPRTNPIYRISINPR